MSKLMNVLCTSLCALTLNTVQADSIGILPENEFPDAIPNSALDPSSIISSLPSQETVSIESSPVAPSDPSSVNPPLPSLSESLSPQPVAPQVVATPKKPKAPFRAFTGKVKGKKVRMRLQPDLDSPIVKELSRGEMLAVVGDADDFWEVESPTGLKAYVFRSFVLDNVIEGSRVNVRLQPSLDAAVLTHLNSGDRIEGSICAANNKWMEISLPSSTHFYVAKSYLENVGAPEVKSQYESRFYSARQQMETADYFAESEMKKNFPDIDFEQMNHNYQIVISEYNDFPDFVEKAKEALSHLQESYIDKRISYMETKQQAEEESFSTEEKTSVATDQSVTDKMKLWEPVEESLYLSWANLNENRSMDDYYSEQKIAAVQLSGILEPYLAPVKCKPGDYIIREKDLPVAYVYSTVINLQNLVGKKVTLVGAPRPNNNFAFPAYFVLAIE
jgi:hypothetical protein